MAVENKKISELTAAAELTGDELLVAEQAGTAVQVSAEAMAKLVAGKLPTYSGTVEVT